MKRLVIGAIAAGVVLVAAGACEGDPTAGLRGGPSILSLNPDQMFINEGATRGIEVTVRDQQLNPVPAAVSATSSAPAVFTVVPDTSVPSADGARFNFVVTAVAPGQARLIVTAAGVTDTALISVLPLAFNGAVSKSNPAGGENIVIRSTPFLKFNPALASVTFGTLVAPIFSATTDSLIVVTPFGATGAATITGVTVTFIPGLVGTLPSAFTVTQTGDFWSGDDAFATAPALPLPAAAGQSRAIVTNVTSTNNSAICAEVSLGFGSTGPCMIYRFDLAADTDLDFGMDWDGGADMDFYVCPDNVPGNCFEDGGGGATGAHPEATGATFTAGTHYLVIERYAGASPTNITVTITRP